MVDHTEPSGAIFIFHKHYWWCSPNGEWRNYLSRSIWLTIFPTSLRLAAWQIGVAIPSSILCFTFLLLQDKDPHLKISLYWENSDSTGSVVRLLRTGKSKLLSSELPAKSFLSLYPFLHESLQTVLTSSDLSLFPSLSLLDGNLCLWGESGLSGLKNSDFAITTPWLFPQAGFLYDAGWILLLPP